MNPTGVRVALRDPHTKTRETHMAEQMKDTEGTGATAIMGLGTIAKTNFKVKATSHRTTSRGTEVEAANLLRVDIVMRAGGVGMVNAGMMKAGMEEGTKEGTREAAVDVTMATTRRLVQRD